MDRPDKRSKKNRKPPRVPIKTYRWEDVRRSRKRGGYPWTYLYKQPFNETIDPSQFRMDSLSRSKSTLNSGEGVSIQEVSDDDRDPSDSLQIVSEPDENNSAHPGQGTATATGNVTIEECHSSDEKPNLESAESSDNISQYLDKEEQPAKASTSSTSKEKETITVENVDKPRAKSEEPKRKRKLSAESSYSRISLSKLGIMKKLKEGKDKLKAAKISLPINKFKKPVPKKMSTKKETTKKQQEASRLVISDKPVYIHIPLKPPPGQTDEFSYLEFEEKKPVTTTTKTTSTTATPAKQPLKINPAFKDLLKNIKKLNEEKAIEESKSQENINLEQDLKTEQKLEESLKPKETLELQEDQNAKSKTEVEKMETESEINDLKEDKPIFEKVKKEKGKGKGKSKIQKEELTLKMDTEEAPNESTEASTSKTFEIDEEVIDTDLQYSVDEETGKSDKENQQSNVDFDELFKPKSIQSKTVQKARAKSEEPERKRKLSIESSYSRKSLSKLGILKKLKETSEKIKSTLSLSRLTSKKESKKEKEKPQEEVKKAPKKIKTEIPKDPVYIHIPLKPPEGETDEFSYLEYGEKSTNVPVEEKIDQTPTETTPSSIQTNDVQFIFLTAPSDDEVLDDHSPEIPETPSSDQKNFFRIDDLKELAKNVVDKLSPATRRKHLETVSEETVSKTSNDEEVVEGEDIDPQKLQVPMNFELDPNRDEVLNKMIVDEEDGLKVERKDKDDKENKEIKETVDSKDELKSNLKATESPVLKKKVSFKRRSKDKDDDYEDVQPPAEEKKDESVLQASQSMSVEEEKPYLDEKIIKSASLEEDYNKWSKSSDHEYEPVNPPPDNTPAEVPSVRIIEAPTSKWIIGEDVKEEEAKFQRTTPEKGESRSESSVHEDQPRGTSKFQKALKDKTDQFKAKLKSIKRPHISMPQAPKFQKPKFNLPHLPKIPDTTVIHLPFKIPGASSKTTTTTTTTTSKRSLKERQLSTESNAGDSKKPLFDFSTYPRIFKRKTEPSKKLQSENIQAFTTTPRNGKKKANKSSDKWGGKETIRIPLHSEDSMDQELKDDFTKNENENFRDNNFREDSVEKRMSSHIRYDDDIDIDDDYHRENQQIHEAALKNEYSRWDHGSFVPDPNKEYFQNVKNQVTDLDSPEDENPQQYETKTKTDSYYSSESSLGTHRRGVLEEINSDEFFLRQKGISQDNIDMGMYLSSEIREAFRTPTSALSQMEGYGSNTSLPEIERHEKRKPMRKPKRKKTPHVSQEQMKSDFSQQMLPPARPKRAGKKKKPVEEFIPYQETISVDLNNEPLKDMGILARSDEEPTMYENEKMEGKEQPEIKITDPYIIGYFEEDEQYLEDKPPAPPRRHKSLKSLSSEHNSIITDTPYDRDDLDNFGIPREEVHEYIISEAKPPRRPARKRSRTRSHSRASSSMPTEEELQSMQETYSTDETPCTEEISYTGEIPCVEEPCIKNLCDYMGYSVVDKKQIRDPPLPPPRTPPRRRRSILAEETKFDTVPRVADKPPVRPLRNYSTLSHSRTPSRISSPAQEEKENIDITQYIEIEDESRDLQSGEVIQKIQNRPLPAPPRPPRHKAKPLKDITSEENIMKKLDNDETKKQVQNDFECEEETFDDRSTHERSNSRNVEPRLILPTHYDYNEETITHGSLVIQPLNGSQILPDSELIRESRERIVPISREDSDEETSEIPEEFKSYRDPPVKEQPERKPMKGGKLQVTDLDVDRLTVNELMASKIVVSEIDSNNIQTTEISSKSGALKVGEISLPPGVVHDILEQLKAAVEERAAQELEQEQEEKGEKSGQKKTSDKLEFDKEKSFIETPFLDESQIIHEEIAERILVDDPPQPPVKNLPHEEAPPERPVRHSRKTEDSDKSPHEPEVDDEPPPRPPQPEYEQIGYIPSQPPASFYALKAQKYVESVSNDNIPVVPRRRRYPKPVSRSTSEEEAAVRPSSGGHRRHLRSSSCEPSIPQLTGQLVRACGSAANHQLKRLINHITDNVLGNRDGQQDMHVMVLILLVLIAGLILLGYGDEKTVVHLHHWEYFNPPRDM